MQIHSCEVMGDKYNIALAPAADQLEALYIVEQTYFSTIYSTGGEFEVTQAKVRAVLADREYFSSADRMKLQELLLKTVCRDGNNTPLTIDDFQGKIEAWRRILAEALIANFSDFFTCTVSDAKAFALEIKAKAKAKQESL